MLLQNEIVPTGYTHVDADGSERSLPSVTLRSSDHGLLQPFVFRFEAVRPNIFRTTFSSAVSHPVPPHPSAKRLAADLTSVSGLEVSSDVVKCTKTITTGDITVFVKWQHTPVICVSLAGVREPLHRDLDFRSYATDGSGVAHYVEYPKGNLHVGLGEKAAPMDLSGRSFLIAASDVFGYNAYHTDPLYKHIPLLISASSQGCVALFSTSHARASWSIGSEIDGLWGRYKVYRQAHGGLEEYLIVGRTLEEIVRSYAGIVGFPMRVPRYMMGYIGGGMKYSMEDDPPAVDAILGFLDNCKKHEIPISAFQMSSGYTVAESKPKTRNVFTWNRHRFPDPRKYIRECHLRGVRVLANIKPYVLTNHPEYSRLAEAGAFFKDPGTGRTAMARLWSAGGGESGEGSHIDFTSRAGFMWWYEGCQTLKNVGVDALWNDNNEFNISNDAWECALETVSTPDGAQNKCVGFWGRALQTELMAKSSHDACVAEQPGSRPLVLTRSATAGTMRYASCSWSGDNVTSWEGMKGANALSLNAGFSLLQTYGHDIGGFEGPQPGAEHLVRWVQLGVHSPRLAINCFKTSPEDNLIGEVIEPWMHPEATPIIREAIRRRYELIPYTYSLALESHLFAVPPQRWTGWGYESDPTVWTDELKRGDTQYWFGGALLIAGVYDVGAVQARVYLPKNNDWHPGFLNVNPPYQHLAAGQWHDISAEWHSSIAVLARCGSAVPVGKPLPTVCRAPNKEEEEEFPGVEMDDWRCVEIYPPPRDLGASGSGRADMQGELCVFENKWLEDDGISSQETADMCQVKLTYDVGGGSDHIKIKIEVNLEGEWEPLWLCNGLDVILPVGEQRHITNEHGSTAKEKQPDVKSRRVCHLAVSTINRNNKTW